MRITKYTTELNEERCLVLVKEKTMLYPAEKQLNSPEKIVKMLNEVFNLGNQSEEYLYMIAFNAKMLPIGVFEISHGTIEQSICSPKDIFKKAFLCNAMCFILAHNHPSGDLTPSKADIESYQQLQKIGKMMGIIAQDSIIVNSYDQYTSLREKGY